MHVDVAAMSLPQSRVRDSLQHVQYLYDSGEDRSKLENLVRAFRGIQALPPTHPYSFFVLAGYHGLNFRGPGETDPEWWGGYCWHETVLFPTWHRAYILHFEDALRSIPGCEDVTLPFWDQLLNLETAILESPRLIPSVLTSPTFDLPEEGKVVNPLYSYVLQTTLNDLVKENRYTKREGYETVRYPLSGKFRVVAAPAPCYNIRTLIYVVYQVWWEPKKIGRKRFGIMRPSQTKK